MNKDNFKFMDANKKYPYYIFAKGKYTIIGRDQSGEEMYNKTVDGGLSMDMSVQWAFRKGAVRVTVTRELGQ